MSEISWFDIWWRRHPLKCVLTIMVILFAIYRTFYYEKKPPSNSVSYRTAHGIMEGRTNELRIKHVLLRFPPGLQPNPYTGDEIVPGQADSVTVDLDLAAWFDPPPIVHSHYVALVEIEIGRSRTEDLSSGKRQLAEQWKSVADRPDLGLREYMRLRDDGGWGYRTYVPIDPGLRTPKGGLIVYYCAGRPGSEPERCLTQYQHARGPYVQYSLSSMLLPRWREVHAEVLRTVDSLIVR